MGRIDPWTRTKQVDQKLAEYDPNSDLPNLVWQSSTSGFPLRCTGPRDQNVEKKQRLIHPLFYISHMLHIQCFLSRHESLVQQILESKSKENLRAPRNIIWTWRHVTDPVTIPLSRPPGHTRPPTTPRGVAAGSRSPGLIGLTSAQRMDQWIDAKRWNFAGIHGLLPLN